MFIRSENTISNLRFLLICLSLVVAVTGCKPGAIESLNGFDECLIPPVISASPADAGFDSGELALIDSVIVTSISDSAFPGAAVAIGLPGTVAYLRGYGQLAYVQSDAVTDTTIYDLASMTKVVATTTSVMLLDEAGAIDLDDPVVEFLPDFGANGKDIVTLRHLLTHTSGLIPFRPYHRLGLHTRQEVLDAIMQDSLQFDPGTRVSYSDLGMITMGLVIEEVAGMSLDSFTERYIFNVLGMCSTGYRSSNETTTTGLAPTEYDSTFRQSLVHGVVHDETAYILGGTAGHAGLFSTANDLARFADMMVSEGRTGAGQFLKEETIRRYTTRPSDGGQSERAIGWDLRSLEGYTSAGEHFGANSFGHTGYTGTSIWIEPDLDVYAILLTNRVHPTRRNRKISAVRPAFATAVGQALIDLPSGATE